MKQFRRNVTNNPDIASKVVHIYRHSVLFTTIFKLLGIALTTFTKYGWSMKWHHSGKSITIRNFMTAASKAGN